MANLMSDCERLEPGGCFEKRPLRLVQPNRSVPCEERPQEGRSITAQFTEGLPQHVQAELRFGDQLDRNRNAAVPQACFARRPENRPRLTVDLRARNESLWQ